MEKSKDKVGMLFAACSEFFGVELADLCDWSFREKTNVKNAQDALIWICREYNLLTFGEITEYLSAPNQAEVLRAEYYAESNTDKVFLTGRDFLVRIMSDKL